MKLDFLIVAPEFTHRSSGVKALYRLCHHLNKSGYFSAIIPLPGRTVKKLPDWELFSLENIPISNEVVIYPEIISGNPYKAKRVVRWALNNPGLLGGDKFFPKDELVFAYDYQRINYISEAAGMELGSNRVLWFGLVDPMYIYPDANIRKSIDCYFVYKGHLLEHLFPLKDKLNLQRIEQITPTAESLGEVLRRTKTLYSYDHYSNILREAAICGCDIRVISNDGNWHDPQKCSCPNNIRWSHNFRNQYIADFHNSAFIDAFIDEINKHWGHLKKNENWAKKRSALKGKTFRAKLN